MSLSRRTTAPTQRAVRRGASSPKRKSDYEKGLDRVLARLTRIDESMAEEGVEDMQLLPDLDVVRRVARKESDSLSGDSVRDAQRMLKNIVAVLAKKADPESDTTLLLEELQKAFDATETLGIKSGFFVGLSRGMSYAFTLDGHGASVVKGGVQ